jgi:hypothetical protein
LPDLNATPNPEHATPDFAAARQGIGEALQALAEMAIQMRYACSDMARLASGLSRSEQGENDVENYRAEWARRE